MSFPFLLLTVFLLSSHSSRASSEFIYPPIEGVNVTLGSKIAVSWTTDWGNPASGGEPYIALVVYQANGLGSWVAEILLGKYLPYLPLPGLNFSSTILYCYVRFVVVFHVFVIQFGR